MGHVLLQGQPIFLNYNTLCFLNLIIMYIVHGYSSVQDDLHTCHGDLFSEAVSSVAESPQVTAVGVNCTHPKHVEVKMVK